MALTYISLSVICSLALAHLLKLSKKSETRLFSVLTINYLVASSLSFLISDGVFVQGVEIPKVGVIAAILLGGIFILNLFIYSASLENIGMGISIAAMRMSLIIPITLSLFYYKESIEFYKYGGILMVLVSLYLMLPKRGKKEVKHLKNTFYPILLFLMTGIADASLKIYDREFNNTFSEYGFLSITFLSAFIIGVSYLIVKNKFSFTKREIYYGLLVGISNLYSSFFLLLALQEMKGSIVFSITNVANVVIGSLIGLIFWKEIQSTTQRVGIALAIISILIIL